MTQRSGLDQAGFLLQRAHRRLRMAHNEALGSLRLNIAHVAVLGQLNERGDLSQRRRRRFLEKYRLRHSTRRGPARDRGQTRS